MNDVFEMIGPVMIGPSSSHTAGAVKIGRMARQLFGEQPQQAQITLAGSFAETGRGHGTDKALVAGLLDYSSADARIRDSLHLAEEAGLTVRFVFGGLRAAHPNTARLELQKGEKRLSMTGCSVGGGSIRIVEIDGRTVDFSGSLDTLLVLHRDTPGVVAAVTAALAARSINIASMNLYRTHRGGGAMLVIETDQETPAALAQAIAQLPHVERVSCTRPV